MISTPAPSAWDHASTLLAGVLAVVGAWVDYHTGSLLTGAGDAALAVAGFSVLGVKGAFPGVLPRA